MALTLRPHLLLLDEQVPVWEIRKPPENEPAYSSYHTTVSWHVVLIEHDIYEDVHLRKRITVLDPGSVLAEGAPQEIAVGLAGQSHGAGRLTAVGCTLITARVTFCMGSAWKCRTKGGAMLAETARAKLQLYRETGAWPHAKGALRFSGTRPPVGRPIALPLKASGYIPEGRRIFAESQVLRKI